MFGAQRSGELYESAKALAGVCNYQRKQNLSDGVANPVTLMRSCPVLSWQSVDETLNSAIPYSNSEAFYDFISISFQIRYR